MFLCGGASWATGWGWRGSALSDQGWRRCRAGSASRAASGPHRLGCFLALLARGAPARPARALPAAPTRAQAPPGGRPRALSSARALALGGELALSPSRPRGPAPRNRCAGSGEAARTRAPEGTGFPRGSPGWAPGGLRFSGLNRTGGDPPQPSAPSHGKAISLGEAWCLKSNVRD